MSTVATNAKVRRIAQSVYVSGFCNIGSHEGDPNFSEKGSLLKACSGSYFFSQMGTSINCTCSCHGAIQFEEPETGNVSAEEEDILSAFVVTPKKKTVPKQSSAANDLDSLADELFAV